MAVKYPLEINGVDFSQMVECDSYETAVEPVYSETVTTIDGVDHTEHIRDRGFVKVKFNPQTAENTAKLCTALLAKSLLVKYRCLQRNAEIYAYMTIDSISSRYLPRVLYGGQKWNETEQITFKEL